MPPSLLRQRPFPYVPTRITCLVGSALAVGTRLMICVVNGTFPRFIHVLPPLVVFKSPTEGPPMPSLLRSPVPTQSVLPLGSLGSSAIAPTPREGRESVKGDQPMGV